MRLSPARHPFGGRVQLPADRGSASRSERCRPSSAGPVRRTWSRLPSRTSDGRGACSAGSSFPSAFDPTLPPRGRGDRTVRVARTPRQRSPDALAGLAGDPRGLAHVLASVAEPRPRSPATCDGGARRCRAPCVTSAHGTCTVTRKI